MNLISGIAHKGREYHAFEEGGDGKPLCSNIRGTPHISFGSIEQVTCKYCKRLVDLFQRADGPDHMPIGEVRKRLTKKKILGKRRKTKTAVSSLRSLRTRTKSSKRSKRVLKPKAKKQKGTGPLRRRAHTQS